MRAKAIATSIFIEVTQVKLVYNILSNIVNANVFTFAPILLNEF